MRPPRRFLAIMLGLGIAACTHADQGRASGAANLPPLTDGVGHTSEKGGKWVKGCPPTPCNMGVGNLGPANTYHWVEG